MDVLWEIIVDRLMHIGEAPLCNGRPDTTFHIFGFCFILCYRCTFIILGLILTSSFISKFKFIYKISKRYQLLIIIFLISFTFVDGVLQYFFEIESNNFRRIVTGFPAGVGMGLFVEMLLNLSTPKKQMKFKNT